MTEPECSIAIVGVGGVFPDSPDLDAFWELIRDGRTAARDVDPARWVLDPALALAPDGTGDGPLPDRVASRRSCAIRDLPAPTRTIPDLASYDPQVALGLVSVERALASTELTPDELARTGLVFGNIVLPTEKSSGLTQEMIASGLAAGLGRAEQPPTTPARNALPAGLPGGVIARAFGFGLGSFTLDAACASSLYAIDHAVRELRAGRARLMVAGGLSRPDPLYTQMGFTQLRALSRAGVPRPFDRRGDGLIVGEGAGFFLLERLEDAVENGRKIWGVIRGIGLSNDIGGSLLAPDSEGQLRALGDAYREAGWTPSQVDLIECHATGTPLGDRIEVESLAALWRPESAAPGQCVLGSVKSNVGHLLTAAGAAGLTKVLLALAHETLPPTAGFEQPHPVFDDAALPFRVLAESTPWARRRDGEPRRAAVSAFGFGGINAHVLVEEYLPGARIDSRPAEPTEDDPIAIVGLAVRTPGSASLSAYTREALGPVSEIAPEAKELPWGLDACAWSDGLGESIGARFESVLAPLGRYRIPPRELEEMLPQQILALETAADALADAGYDPAEGPRTGVFIGIALDLATTDFSFRWAAPALAARWQMDAAPLLAAAGPALNANRTMGALGGIVASRIAREFKIGGPSYTVSSEETSGTRALEVAVRALESGRLDRALVGAVDRGSDPRQILARQELTGQLITGEDASVAMVLERLSDARRHGHPVYALIRNVEAGGPESREAPTFDGRNTGAASTNTGAASTNTGAATGLVDVARQVLSLATAILPDTALPDTVRGPCYWLHDRASGPRRSRSITSAVDGNWTAVDLEEAPRADARRINCPLGPAPLTLFTLRADDIDALTEHCAARADLSVEELAWTFESTGVGERIAFVVADRAELALALERIHRNALGGAGPRIHRGDAGGGDLAFVYPGSGNHFVGMGREVSAWWPAVFRAQEEANARLATQYRADIYWHATAPDFEPAETAIFGQVATGALYTDLLAHFGVQPDAVIGYSLGETAGLFSTRTWSDRDEMLGRMEATDLFRRQLAGPHEAAARYFGIAPPIEWRLGVVNVPAAQVRESLVDVPRVFLLIVNTPTECVIGGEAGAVETWLGELATRHPDHRFHEIDGVTSVHCPVAEPVREPYRALHIFPTTPPLGVRFYSGVRGGCYDVTTDTAADSIVEQALHGFEYPEVIESAYRDGLRTFVELGPGASCTRMIDAILGDRAHRAFSLCRRQGDGLRHFLEGLAALHAAGVAIDRRPLHARPLGLGVRPFEGTGVEIPAIPRPLPRTLPPVPDRPAEPRPAPRMPAATRAPRAGDAPLADVIARLRESERQTALAHDAYLSFAQEHTEAVTRLIRRQTALYRTHLDAGHELPAARMDRPDAVSSRLRPPARPDLQPIFDYSQCLTLAIGRLADVLGPEFEAIDAHATRVRLPDEPLMLVHRITELEGDPRSLTKGRVVTEHDVWENAWYLDAGRLPTAVTVEAGQADLFLSGYLGIDFHTRGEAVYRLLDAEVCFHRSLPVVGETIRYDIAIDEFFYQGETALFRFRFEGTVNGEPLLSMRKGCAGFFTERELALGQGIVKTALDLAPQEGRCSPDWQPLVPMARESYPDAGIEALRRGELAGCFGPAFANLPLRDPVRLPGEWLTLVHRIVDLEPGGGRFGLGVIRGEADIQPDDWFLTCHFSDDQVMPGTLMYECCLHTLRVYLMRLGWVGEASEVVYEPVPGVRSRLKCRGQVTESTKKVVYEIDLKEIGYRPEPYVIVDALMYADGKPIVDIGDMSLRLSGLTRERLEEIWGASSTAARDGKKPAIYDDASITAFAIGKPSDAFGEPYRIFDEGRIIARLPGPPYKFLDRVTEIRGGQPFVLQSGVAIEAQYDVPSTEWYFADNRSHEMSFAVLLEVALQPCGWLAAYLGSALTSDEDLKFRNLGGSATKLRPVTRDSGTLSIDSKLTRLSQSGGMIIQHFDLAVRDVHGTVYEGTTYFGFFTHDALANQVGIREAQPYRPTDDAAARGRSYPYPAGHPWPVERLRMVDQVALHVADGGPAGLGFLRGVTKVRPDEWFFAAHFHQDPVCPGSLGLEAFLQLLGLVAVERFAIAPDEELRGMAVGEPHEWVYRGQYIPTDDTVTVECCVTRIDPETRTVWGEGYLSVDGRVIYRMERFSVSVGRSE